ncbi:PKD domain-containing protein [Thermoplasmatota archaeon]
MKRNLIIKFCIPVSFFLIISPVCISLNDHNTKENFIEFFSINNLYLEHYRYKSSNQGNISFDIQVKDADGVWHNYNITAFNNSILEFNVELKTTRGYQFLASALSLPNTDNGSLLYIFNNSFQYSKKPTITDIGNRDILLLWLPVLLQTTITFNFMAKIQNIGIEKEALGAVIGSIDYESFDIVNDSFYITSIPSPIPDIPNQPEGPISGLPDTIYNYSTKTIDPDSDQVYYKWDWGDQIISDWNGPYNSGEVVHLSHSWRSRGNYNIKVKARDDDWHESEWSDSLSVSMPKSKSYDQIPRIILWLFERFPFLQSYFSNFL